jgi:hypothetical protein
MPGRFRVATRNWTAFPPSGSDLEIALASLTVPDPAQGPLIELASAPLGWLSADLPIGAVASGTRRVAWQAGPREGIPGVW